MAYNVYSLPDVKSTIYHPDVGTANLHEYGIGKLTISSAGDYASHTTTSDGYVIVNRLKTTNGTITIEVPQNSKGDAFLRKWAKYAKNPKKAERMALGTLTVTDKVSGFKTSCTGVCLQKAPDRTYDRTATNVTYTFLCADITEK